MPPRFAVEIEITESGPSWSVVNRETGVELQNLTESTANAVASLLNRSFQR